MCTTQIRLIVICLHYTRDKSDVRVNLNRDRVGGAADLTHAYYRAMVGVYRPTPESLLLERSWRDVTLSKHVWWKLSS